MPGDAPASLQTAGVKQACHMRTAARPPKDCHTCRLAARLQHVLPDCHCKGGVRLICSSCPQGRRVGVDGGRQARAWICTSHLPVHCQGALRLASLGADLNVHRAHAAVNVAACFGRVLPYLRTWAEVRRCSLNQEMLHRAEAEAAELV